MRLRHLVAGMAVAGLAVAGPAGAVGSPEVGWWFRAQTGLLTPLPPPAVGADEFMVGSAPDGATAVAAFRFGLDEGETNPTVTLKVTRADGPDKPVLAACKTGSAWFPEDAGRFQNKPLAACDAGSITGTPSADGKTYTFALAPLVQKSAVDVVLVPGVVEGRPAGANGAVFNLVFKDPTSSDVMTTTADSGSFDSGSFDSGSAFDAGSSTDTFAPDSPSEPTTSFDSTGGELPAPDTGEQAFTPALTPAEQSPVATPPAAQDVEVASGPRAPVPDSTPGRILALLVLLGAGAAAAQALFQPVPALRGLGRVTPTAPPPEAAQPVEPVQGGLGRFRTARTSAAPQL